MKPIDRWLASLLVGLYFAARCWFINAGYFVDEADNLAWGRLIGQGFGLYRDLFSHHLPLPYYWTALAFRLFGPSVFSARFSLLLIEILTLTLAFRLTTRPRAMALFLLAWTPLAHLYWAHMVTLYAFSRLGLFAGLVTVLFTPTGELYRLRTSLLLGLAAGLTVTADAFGWVPMGLLYLWRFIRRPVPARTAAELLLLISFLGLLGLAAVAFQLLDLTELWRQVVVFNTGIYPRYMPLYRDLPGGFLNQVVTGLGLLDDRWLRAEVLPVLEYETASRWVFTGFFLRAGILLGVASLFLSGRRFEALLLYGFSAALLVRSPEFFPAATFIMTALFLTVTLVVFGWPEAKPAAWVGRLLRVALVAGVIWLSLGAWRSVVRPTFLEVHAGMARGFEANAEIVRRLSCGRADVAAAEYPGGIHLNFLTGLRPVARFGLLWPWMADWGLDEVLDFLRTRPTIIMVQTGGDVLGFKTDYLQSIAEFVNQEYVAVDGFYVAPEIIANCPTVRPYLNYLAAVVQHLQMSAFAEPVVLTDEPHLVEYVSRLVGRPVRATDPVSGLLLPEAGGCYVIAPARLWLEFRGWQGLLPEPAVASDRPWPVLCVPGPQPAPEVRAVWDGPVVLEAVLVKGEPQPGSEIEVVSWWDYRVPDGPATLHVFHHLVSATGLVAQVDGPLEPGPGWRPGDRIGLRYRLRFPDDLKPGTYLLRIGLYRWPSLERLKTWNGQDAFDLEIMVR